MHKDIIKKLTAFTLAEVLITLAIIGVVAALTIPSVIISYKDKQYNTARLKALKTFGEAGKLASINDEINGQNNAADFVNNVLSKYLKISKVCTLANSEDCGFPSYVQASNPETAKTKTTNLAKWSQIGQNRSRIGVPTSATNLSIVISTADGFSALIHYNPKCGRTSREITEYSNCTYKECIHYNMDATCMNAIYDMNGIKGPNHIGEDMGIVTVLWSGIKSVAAAPGIIPYSINTTGTTTETYVNATNVCKQKEKNKVEYALPSVDELSSIVINSYLVSLPEGSFWSGSPVADRPGMVYFSPSNGYRSHDSVADTLMVWCVRH